MPIENPCTTLYRVEVSGWDSAETFFVENTKLEWNGENGKKVHLRHPLRTGAVVFVRLIDSPAAGDSFPIAYRAESVSPPDSRGVCRVSLAPLRPRSRTAPSGEQIFGEQSVRL